MNTAIKINEWGVVVSEEKQYVIKIKENNYCEVSFFYYDGSPYFYKNYYRKDRPGWMTSVSCWGVIGGYTCGASPLRTHKSKNNAIQDAIEGIRNYAEDLANQMQAKIDDEKQLSLF